MTVEISYRMRIDSHVLRQFNEFCSQMWYKKGWLNRRATQILKPDLKFRTVAARIDLSYSDTWRAKGTFKPANNLIQWQIKVILPWQSILRWDSEACSLVAKTSPGDEISPRVSWRCNITALNHSHQTLHSL